MRHSQPFGEHDGNISGAPGAAGRRRWFDRNRAPDQRPLPVATGAGRRRAGVAVPAAPKLELDPELMLALFVAPVLLDAAYDTSVRDLRANWIPITCLVIAAVGITTVAVAWTVHALVPSMPWAAAIALGAIVAPPDAAAASAILKQLRLPHRLLVILQDESLLNDASALMIYRIAVLAVASGGLNLATVVPMSLLSIVGSVIAGYLLARLSLRFFLGITDVPSSIVMQFATTFGVWILAEHLHLSAIVTIVVYGITVARDAPRLIPARNRLPSYAVWDLAVFVLNVLAFVLIGLQLRPILGALAPEATSRVFPGRRHRAGHLRRCSIRVGVQLCGGRAAESCAGSARADGRALPSPLREVRSS